MSDVTQLEPKVNLLWELLYVTVSNLSVTLLSRDVVVTWGEVKRNLGQNEQIVRLSCDGKSTIIFSTIYSTIFLRK